MDRERERERERERKIWEANLGIRVVVKNSPSLLCAEVIRGVGSSSTERRNREYVMWEEEKVTLQPQGSAAPHIHLIHKCLLMQQ